MGRLKRQNGTGHSSKAVAKMPEPVKKNKLHLVMQDMGQRCIISLGWPTCPTPNNMRAAMQDVLYSSLLVNWPGSAMAATEGPASVWQPHRKSQVISRVSFKCQR